MFDQRDREVNLIRYNGNLPLYYLAKIIHWFFTPKLVETRIINGIHTTYPSYSPLATRLFFLTMVALLVYAPINWIRNLRTAPDIWIRETTIINPPQANTCYGISAGVVVKFLTGDRKISYVKHPSDTAEVRTTTGEYKSFKIQDILTIQEKGNGRFTFIYLDNTNFITRPFTNERVICFE